MAIVSVHQLRSFEYSESKGSKGSVDMKGSVDFIAKFDGEVDFNVLVEDQTVWSSLGNRPIPMINDLELIGGIPFYVTSRKFSYFKGDEQERAAKITVEYDNKKEDPDPPEEPQDTDAETWKKITITTEQQQIPLTNQGINGEYNANPKPARNSAGDPVDGLTENRCLLKLTYTNTQVANPNFQALFSYVNTTNDGPFLGGARRTVLCQGYSGDYDDKRQLWNISVEWLYDPKQHVVKYYDAGFNELIGDQRRAILDVANNPVSKPVPLNGLGGAMPPADLAHDRADDYIVTLIAYPYEEKTMSNIFSEGGI
jgi:hypothetical protein